MTTPPPAHRCATADIALPPDARILVLGSGSLPLTAAAGSTLVRCSSEEAAGAAALQTVRAAAGDEPFDVIVVGQDVTSTTPARPLLTLLRTVLEPSGQLLARFPNAASGTRRLQALAGRAPAPGALTRSDLHTALEDSGFRIDVDSRCYAAFTLDEAVLAGLGVSPEQQQRLRADRESYVEHHAVAASPVWTDGERAATDLALATAPAAEIASGPLLVVASVGVLARDRRVSYRLSLPPQVELRFLDAADDKVLRGALADLPGGTAVLRTTPAVEPDARWVGRLWSAWSQGAEPVGCRLIDAAGTVVHASADPVGRVFAAGTSWSEHPVVTADRSPATLRPPFLAAAEALREAEPVHGRHLGDVAARCRSERRRSPEGVQSITPSWSPGATPGGGPPEPRQPARLSSAFPGAVLFLDDAPPSRRSTEEQAQLSALWDALRAAGRTPVLHWDVADLLHARSAQRALERRGVLTFGGDASLELPAGTPASQLQPGAAALATALAAEAVVYLSGRRFSQDATDVALAVPRTPIVVAAGGTSADTDADLVQPLATEGFTERVLALLAAPPAGSARQVHHVAARPPQPGLTSIIIPVWNLWQLTQRCLDAITANTRSPFEVVVVDNGSTDDTPSALAGRAVTVISNPTNLGFAAACNQGIDAARGEFVCVLNNDTEVTPGWLEALLAVLADDSVGLVGPRSNSISGPQVVPGAPGLADAGAAHAWARSWTDAARGSWPVRRLVGFCLLGRRRTFEEIGGFDTGYGIGNFEDDDLCDRVLASGRQLRVCDGAVVLHHGSATFQSARIDWSTTLRSGARRFAAGRAASPGGLLTAVVLSDGEPEAVRAALAACAAVADAGVAVERRSLVATELAVESGLKACRRVVGADWHDGRALARVLRGVRTDFAVVLRAREVLRCDDWGQLRAALDASPRRALGVRVAGGGEVRIVAPAGDGAAALGRRTEELLPGLAILPPAARRLAS